MSTLLEQASLVMIPSGYKEDVVYSQIPTSGAGDLSFTRASNGTRINSAGLVEVCPWNLLQQSETFENAAWNTYQSTITANATTAPNGTTTADTISYGTSPISSCYQSVTNGAGIFTLSVYAKCASGTQSFKFIMYNSADGQVDSPVYTVTTEWQRFQHSFTVTQPSTWYIANANDSVTRSIYIWGAQLNIGATAKPYFPTTDRLNVPRLTYQNGGGGCPSLLLEKQSTNLCLYSEQFNAVDWTSLGTITITANATTSPDGTLSADLILGADGVAAINQIINGSTSVVYTNTIYIKNNNSTQSNLRIRNTVTAVECLINWDSNVLTSITNSTGTTTFQSVGNGWYRLISTYTSIEAVQRPRIYPTTGSNQSVYIWGAQLEAGAYPTTYIPTTSSSATRVADACLKSGIGSLIGQTEGAFMIDVDLKSRANYTYFLINNTTSNYIGIAFNFNAIVLEVVNTAVLQSQISLSNSATGRFKIAGAYANNDFVLYINGTQVGTDTSGSVPATSQVDLYYNTTNTIQYNEVVLFKTRLTNAELASLTTI